jgi:acetyl-CoA C-acetyltransferase
MEPRLVIAGAAQSGYSRRGSSARLEDLIFQTAAAALDDGGLTRADIDSVVIAASDAKDGRCISSMLTAHAAGAYLKDEIKVADEGAFGLLAAALRLLTGEFHTSLVVTWSKPSESPYQQVQTLQADPFYHRPFGLNHTTSMALLASAYQRRFGVDDSAPASVVVKNRAHGRKNQLLDAAPAVTTEEVLHSPYVAYPLRALEIAPPSDGACALVLTTEERARGLKQPPVYLRGMGWATDSYFLGERELTRFTALEKAARQAYAAAGITDPPREIDVAEIYDATAWHELLAYEALGFCGPGEGGAFAAQGRLATNPSGGCLSAYPVFAAGLTRVIEAYLQVAGRAGDRQVPNARVALAQAAAGQAGQSHAVFLLSRS